MAKVVIIGNLSRCLITFRGPLIKEMIENGHDVIACAPDAPENIKEELNKLGASYHDISLDRTGMNFLQDLRGILNMVRFLKRVKPDVVLTYTIKPNIYGSISANIAKVPMVGSIITGLGHPFSDSASVILKLATVFLYRLAITKKHVMFFQNRDDMDLFLEKKIVDKQNRLVLINGSGVDIKYFSSKKLPAQISFLLIARLLKEKGVREYAEAAKILKKKYPDIVFRLVGPIKDDRFHITQDELDQWVKEGRIEFLGFLDDVRNAVEDAFVYVLPSYREGTPRSVLEAMAMSRPIITTDAPGCRETVIDGVNGFLIPVGDSEALAKAMEKFILQPSMGHMMASASRRIAEEKFDVEKVNHVILDNLGLLSNPCGQKSPKVAVNSASPD